MVIDWNKLIYEAIQKIISFGIPFLFLWFASLLFKDAMKDFKQFIIKSFKAEFKTDVGRINLVGFILIVIVLIVPEMEKGINANTKAFLLGGAFVLSLIITGSCEKKNKNDNS